MPLKECIGFHWDELARKRETVVEALSWSVTGRNLQRECKELSSSEIMQKLMIALTHEKANAIDRFKMAEYLALALEHNPEHNLQRFIAYLELISNKTHSARRAEYYTTLKIAVIKFMASQELHDYMEVYNEFKNDPTKEATLARDILDEVTSTAKKIMGEYS
jgi:hypothetical protein